MQVIASAFRGIFALAVSFMFIDEAGSGPLPVESDAGIVVMDTTVQTIDVTRQLVTVVGPNGNVLTVNVGPEHIALIKERDQITIRYADEVATALRKSDGPPKTDGSGFVA